MDAKDDLLIDLTDDAARCERCDAPPQVRLLPLLTGPTAVWMCSRGHGAVALVEPPAPRTAAGPAPATVV